MPLFVTPREKQPKQEQRQSTRVLLSQVSFIERLIAELPKQTPSRIGHNAPPINDNDFRAIEGAIAVLKVQPVVPTAPDEARNAGLTLKIIGERIRDIF